MEALLFSTRAYMQQQQVVVFVSPFAAGRVWTGPFSAGD